MGGKLHALLAVEPDKKGAAEKILKEAIVTFSKKQEHFYGQLRHYTTADEADEVFADEKKEMVTTVKDKLEYTEKALVDLFDIIYQKENANLYAKADLVINDVVLAESVPATVLLNMENRLKQIREMYFEIPTLLPDEDWRKDPTTNTYKAPPRYTYKTKKISEALVLYPATDKHPAQVKEITKDVRQGTWETTKWSGAITPVEKSELIGRVDTLIQAVKVARMRANDQEVDTSKRIGRRLFDFINTGF